MRSKAHEDHRPLRPRRSFAHRRTRIHGTGPARRRVAVPGADRARGEEQRRHRLQRVVRESAHVPANSCKVLPKLHRFGSDPVASVLWLKAPSVRTGTITLVSSSVAMATSSANPLRDSSMPDEHAATAPATSGVCVKEDRASAASGDSGPPPRDCSSAMIAPAPVKSSSAGRRLPLSCGDHRNWTFLSPVAVPGQPSADSCCVTQAARDDRRTGCRCGNGRSVG